MMESTQQRAEQLTPLKSAAGDVRRAKSAAAASVKELRVFLQKHRGKSSKELLGELGQSSLVQAMVKSTLGTVVLLAVLTVVPYFTQGEPQPKKAKTAQKSAAPSNPAAAAGTPAATTAATNNSGAPNGVDVDKAKKVMGLDETKSAPDNVNPREKDLDNLLDGVK